MNFTLTRLSPRAPEARHKSAQPVQAGWVNRAIPGAVGAAHFVIPFTPALAPCAPGNVVILRQTDKSVQFKIPAMPERTSTLGYLQTHARIALSKRLDRSPLTVPCSLTTTHYSLLTTRSPQ